MAKLPGALVVIDVHREGSAVREAKKLGIPTVCLIDTDSDPDFADLPIPGNDDATRSIETILTHLVAAVEEGLKARMLPESDEATPQQKHTEQPVTGRAEVSAVGGSHQPSAVSHQPEGEPLLKTDT